MNSRKIFCTALLLALAFDALAWGPEGHRVIGRAAFDLLDDRARSKVLDLLGLPPGSDPAQALADACNWPDAVREEPGWRWSAPLHYVNIARHGDGYLRERDCPDGRCVTEGILDYANRLANAETTGDDDARFQAFAFVCHLVADLHQPLHAGFRDDRGGNTVRVEYRGEEMNLHRFWDSAVIRSHLESENRLVEQLGASGASTAAQDWNPAEVVAWTDESHALAAEFAYPAGYVIDEAFAERSWSITIGQWERASGRLAQVLNAVLGENDVRLEAGSEVAGDPEADPGVPRRR